METILVVEDELSMREFFDIMLKREGYDVALASGGEEAVKFIDNANSGYDLCICDMKMPRVGGLDVLKRSREKYPDVPVIMITAYSSTESAIEAMKIGAYDYITKPFNVDEIRLVINKAIERGRLMRENIELKEQLEERDKFKDIVAVSKRMQEVFDLISAAAPTKANVLVTGESGTGKELVARAIHSDGPRKDGPFVTINCSAIPPALMESELFGHKKGSFTGAHADRRGRFEVAQGGTIFLDEIGEIDKNLQVKLLRIIQEKSFTPVGANKEIEVDVRIISATNKDLEAEIKSENFREDLFYRLNVIHIIIPPLRERPEDIPRLVSHFLEKYSNELGKSIGKVSAGAMALLESYAYPGNVRELENIIERAVALEATEVLSPQSLPGKLTEEPVDEDRIEGKLPDQGLDLEGYLEKIESELIKNASARSGGSKTRAAKLLGLTPRSLRYRMRKLGIED